jgi:hypothetical protein
MLSPRRTKPDPAVVLYELRTVRASKPLQTMRAIESRIKKWRGLLRWTMHAFASSRGEAVIQVVGERQSQVARRDNLFYSWQRAVKTIGGVECARATWATAPNGSSFFADARVLHEVYEVAVAKVAEEAMRVDAGTLTCTDLLPLLPPPVGSAAVNATAGASHSASAPQSGPQSAPQSGPQTTSHAMPTPSPSLVALPAQSKTVSLSSQAFAGMIDPPKK